MTVKSYPCSQHILMCMHAENFIYLQVSCKVALFLLNQSCIYYFSGLGFLMVTVSAMMSWYYITVLAWVLYYLVNSFYHPLPWSDCSESWNTAHCIESRIKDFNNVTNTIVQNITSNSSSLYNISLASETGIKKNATTAAKEFWQ